MRRLQAIVIVLIACMPACSTGRREPNAPSGPTELIVFAAASLTEPFQEIGREFERANPGVRVTFNFGGSQQLAQQLVQGAPADVFASANDRQMGAAIAARRVGTDSAHTFVRNRLVVVVPKENPGHVASLDDLAKPGLKLVLAAKEVPVGQYGLEMLDKAGRQAEARPGFKEAVLANVVSYEQNVKAVLAKVLLGEADAGVVYTSDISKDAAAKVSRIDIPDAANVVASYPIAVVEDTAHAAAALRFVDFVRSPAGQSVLARYGFDPVAEPASGPSTTATRRSMPAPLAAARSRFFS